MRKAIFFRNVVVFVILFSACAAAAPAAGKITLVIGAAQLKHKGAPAWMKAKIGAAVRENDTVKTGAESRCEITLASDRCVRLDENTLVAVVAGSADNTSLKTTRGMLYINVKKLLGSRKFNLATPTATAAIRGTVFGTECDANKSNFIVMNGTVAVALGPAGKDSTVLVSPGEQFTVVKDIDLYLKQQEKAFKEFMKSDQEEFEKFQKQDEEALEKFQQEEEKNLQELLRAERAAFAKVGVLNTSKRRFDMEKVLKLDWVKWNRELDKKLNW